MRKLIGVVGICLLAFPVFCQTGSNYQVATIIDVKTHQAAGGETADADRYDIAVKVGDTIYTVLYISPMGMSTVKYAMGRNLLVLVGKKTITYNDLLGRSMEVPIVDQKPATIAKQSSESSGRSAELNPRAQ